MFFHDVSRSSVFCYALNCFCLISQCFPKLLHFAPNRFLVSHVTSLILHVNPRFFTNCKVFCSNLPPSKTELSNATKFQLLIQRCIRCFQFMKFFNSKLAVNQPFFHCSSFPTDIIVRILSKHLKPLIIKVLNNIQMLSWRSRVILWAFLTSFLTFSFSTVFFGEDKNDLTKTRC